MEIKPGQRWVSKHDPQEVITILAKVTNVEKWQVSPTTALDTDHIRDEYRPLED